MSEDPRIKKLPKWAQERMVWLERKAEHAAKELKRVLDNQTPSPFYTDVHNVHTRSFDRIYFQAHRIDVAHAGLEVSVYPTRQDDSQRDYGVEVTFCAVGDNSWGACVRPTQGGFLIMAPEEVERELKKRREWQASREGKELK